MSTTMDPTVALLESFADPAKWVTTDHVAVFRAHERTEDLDGHGSAVLYEVTDDDLEEIAENTNTVYSQSGQPVRLTVGHSQHEPGFPESEQPELVGFCLRYQVQVVHRPGGSFLAVTHTEKVLREHASRMKRYPYRSVEYDPASKLIVGCAALLRSPYLNLGAVIPYAGTSTTYRYSLGATAVDKFDDAQEEKVKTAIMNNEADGDDEWTDADEMPYQSFCKYMRKYESMKADTNPEDDTTKPVMNEGGGAMAAMGAGNGGLPDMAKPMMNQNGKPLTNYERVLAEVAQLKRNQAESQRQVAYERSARLLDSVKGVVSFDEKHELEALVSLPNDTARANRISYMLTHYQKLPTGGMIQVARPSSMATRTNNSDNDPTVAPPKHDTIMAYVRANPGMTYDDAKSRVINGK